jgi:hypothetical protein
MGTTPILCHCCKPVASNTLLQFYGAESPTGETGSCSDCQEIPLLLWNPKVHYRIHRCLPLEPIRRHIKSVHILTRYFSTTHQSSLFPSDSPAFFRPMHFSFPPCVLHVPPLSSASIWTPQYYLTKSINYKAPHYVLFFILLLISHSDSQIFSSDIQLVMKWSAFMEQSIEDPSLDAILAWIIQFHIFTPTF